MFGLVKAIRCGVWCFDVVESYVEFHPSFEGGESPRIVISSDRTADVLLRRLEFFKTAVIRLVWQTMPGELLMSENRRPTSYRI